MEVICISESTDPSNGVSLAGCNQLLVVESPAYTSSRAQLRRYQFDPETGQWTMKGSTGAAIGQRGMTFDKREGDYRTPMGVFPMGAGFGTLPAPGPMSWSYRIVDAYDYWVDDPESPDYNQWVRCEGDSRQRWKSFERLSILPYEYASVIRYNDSPVVPGRGSAIFLHVWGGPDSYSAGCVTVEKREMANVLQWMVPEQLPRMAIGTRDELNKWLPFQENQIY